MLIEGTHVHKSVPDDRIGRVGASIRGRVSRVTPSGRGIPAQAYVIWDDQTQTWELTRNLEAVGTRHV